MNIIKLIIVAALILITQQVFSQTPYRTKDTIENRPINKTISSFNFYYKPVKFSNKTYNYFYYNRMATLTTPQPFTINFRIRNHY